MSDLPSPSWSAPPIATSPAAPQARVVVEKPFGHDLGSARALARELHRFIDESQLYRIDHFLGKEATQDLHTLRFANGLFDAMWNRRHVESVQIDVPEKLGITDRSVFYDATGAVLDMLVTHLFQVAAEVAMEPPASLGALDLQAAREKVIKSFRPIDPAEVVLGQFTGYRKVPGVAAKSGQNTFVAARLWIDNPRWRGVPFYLRTGKRLAETRQRVSLVLRDPPGPLAGQLPGQRAGRLAQDQADPLPGFRQPLAGAQVERHAAPAGVVDPQPGGHEGVRAGPGGHPGDVAVAGELAEHHLGRVERAEAGDHLLPGGLQV
jgi:glucose-6-phosphate 1-dehydrogenase